MDERDKKPRWWVYIIRAKDESLYTGVTVDIERRFKEHQANGVKTAKYLRGKQPLELVYSFEVGDKKQAYSVEWHIKKLTKKHKEQLTSQQKTLVDFGILRPSN